MTEKRVLRGNHCQCDKCGEYFNSVAAFDKHRTGEHGDRKCRTTDEMLAAGMAMSNGWWVTAKSPDFHRRDKGRDMDRIEQDELYSGINSYTRL